MESKANTTADLLRELEETRRQLYEANETIEAIRTGQVDALVVQSGASHQLYSLRTADHAYRLFIEKMTEGAVTLNRQGIIDYGQFSVCRNARLPLSIIGLSFEQFVARRNSHSIKLLICHGEKMSGELAFGIIYGLYLFNCPSQVWNSMKECR